MAVVFETEDYRSSREWQALNRIWKAVPAGAREGVKEDFRLITEVIKAMGRTSEVPKETPAVSAAPVPAAPGARENFLRGMSPQARKLALSLLTKEGFDVYAYLERLMAQSKAKNADELWDAYVSERDIEGENEEALREIVEVCAARGN